jgi:hypothetical protein
MRAAMRHILPIVLAVLAAACLGEPAAAQSVAAKARAISVVMQHRAAYLADSLRFDACSVKGALDGADGYASHLAPQARRLLDGEADACPRPFQQGRSVAMIDSVRVADSAVQVFVSVQRGEMSHRETYTLEARGSYVGVREVRASDFGQAYPARPRTTGTQ